MKNCLIVDDSGVVRTVARRILQELDFVCHEAENGQQAYDACMGQLPDIILLDWNMPVMSGIEFIELLRKSPGGEEPKVIFCTAEKGAEQIRRAIKAGANEYIIKPFDQNLLESKLKLVGLLD